jgi:hypothetical protein
MVNVSQTKIVSTDNDRSTTPQSSVIVVVCLLIEIAIKVLAMFTIAYWNIATQD